MRFDFWEKFRFFILQHCFTKKLKAYSKWRWFIFWKLSGILYAVNNLNEFVVIVGVKWDWMPINQVAILVFEVRYGNVVLMVFNETSCFTIRYKKRLLHRFQHNGCRFTLASASVQHTLYNVRFMLIQRDIVQIRWLFSLGVTIWKFLSCTVMAIFTTMMTSFSDPSGYGSSASFQCFVYLAAL